MKIRQLPKHKRNLVLTTLATLVIVPSVLLLPDYVDMSAIVETILSAAVLIVLFVVNAVILWPFATQWKNDPALLEVFSTAFLFLVGIGIQTSPWTIFFIVWLVLLFIGANVLLTLTIAIFSDAGIRGRIWARIRKWLLDELGEPPEAYLMGILWGGAIFASIIILVLLPKSLLVVNFTEKPPFSSGLLLQFPKMLSALFLAAYLVVIFLHQLLTREKKVTYKQGITYFGLLTLLILCIYWLQDNLFFAPFGSDITSGARVLRETIWSVIIYLLILVLAFTRRHKLTVAWKTALVGLFTGIVLALLLEYPTRAYIYANFVPTFTYETIEYQKTFAFSLSFAILLSFFAAPLAVKWSKAGHWLERLAIGAVVGGLAGSILFGFLGAPMAGIAANAPIYNVALSRVGFSASEWILKLVLAVNASVFTPLSVFWALIGGGGIIGALTGVLTPGTSTHRKSLNRPPAAWPLIVLAISIPLLELSTVLDYLIFALLGGLTQNTLESFGYEAGWYIGQMASEIAFSSWLGLLLVQTLGLIWLRKRASHITWAKFPSIVAIWGGLLGMLFPVFRWLCCQPSPIEFVAISVNGILGIEMFITGCRLWHTADIPQGAGRQISRQGMIAAGIGSVVGIAILSYDTIAISLSLEMIPVPMISTLMSPTAPTPGLEWLVTLLHTATTVYPPILIIFLGWAAIVGAVIGLGLSYWPWAWVRWLWHLLEPVLHAAKLKFAHWSQQRAAWLKFACAIVGLLLILAKPAEEYRFSTLFATLILLCVISPRYIERLTWSILGLAFILPIIFEVVGMYFSLSSGVWSRVYILFVGASLATLYRATMYYASEDAKSFLRITTLLGIAIFFGLSLYLKQNIINISGGVARYDGLRWERFSSENSFLGNRMKYHFFRDKQGNLWYGSRWVMVNHDEEGWHLYEILEKKNDETSLEYANLAEDEVFFLEDKTNRLWIASGKRVGQFDPTSIDASPHFRSVGRKKISSESANSTDERNGHCEAEAVQRWNKEGSYISEFVIGGNSTISALVTNPGNGQILTVDTFGIAQIWDADGNLVAKLPNLVASAEYSPSGNLIVTINKSSSDSNLMSPAYLWDNKGTMLAVLDKGSKVVKAIFSQDGNYIITVNTDNQVFLWNREGNLISVLLNPQSHPVEEIAISPNSSQILIAGKKTARLVNMHSSLITTFEEPASTITSVAFSPDGQYIVTGNMDGTAKLWSVDGQLITTLLYRNNTSAIERVGFSPNGHYLFTVSRDNAVRLWDSKGGLVNTISFQSQILTIRFSPDGARIVIITGDVTDDKAATLLDGQGKKLTTLEMPNHDIEAVAFSSNNEVIFTAGCIDQDGYETLVFDKPITGMATSANGDIWLGTAGQGVVRLEGGHIVENTPWQFYTNENSNLSSDNVSMIYADKDGSIWCGTDNGLNHYNGQKWETVNIPGLGSNATTITAFFEDNAGQFWTGSNTGGAWQNGNRWVLFDDMPGWPGRLEITGFFEDSQNGIWVGTDTGALRFNGKRWAVIIPEGEITSFAESPEGVIWIGSHHGLFRYDLMKDQSVRFDSENSSMPSNWVRDLYVDTEGNLLVSTFNVKRTKHSPWGIAGFGILFFGYLFGNAYRGYERMPRVSARRLGETLLSAPETALSQYYQLLQVETNGRDVLGCIPEQFSIEEYGDWVRAAKNLSILVSKNSDIDGHLLKDIANQLSNASALNDARELSVLYDSLSLALSCHSVAQIANWRFQILRGEVGSQPMWAGEMHEPVTLPSFINEYATDTLDLLSRIAVLLDKYSRIDSSQDKLTYLADALSAIEKAIRDAAKANSPERFILQAVTMLWRDLINTELNHFSGQAELRLDLRTRQLRRSEKAVLSAHLQNTGHAMAENVIVILQLETNGETDSKMQVTLESVASNSIVPVEFTFIPPEGKDAIRVFFQVVWDDRVERGRKAEFADIVRFYETSNEFQRIPNPYIVGHPVKSADVFYGRDDVFRFITENISGTLQDRTLVLYGQRRTGKTSVLYQVSRGLLGDDFIPVLIDMQELALLVNSTGDFLSEIAYQLTRAIRKAGIEIDEPSPDVFEITPTRTFNRFLDTLEDTLGNRRIVCMFDEFELIEDKIADGKLDTEILGYFRSLIQHRDNLVFIFTGTHKLEEMTHDYWSVLFNIALYHHISFLDLADATKLIRNPVAGYLDIDELAVEKILDLTRGHPYYIQLLCWALVNHCNAQERNYATVNDVNDALHEILTTGKAHFAFIWNQANAFEKLVLAGLAQTLRRGKHWARPVEIQETLIENGASFVQRDTLIEALDHLVILDVLETADDGNLRYRFQLNVLAQWVSTTKSISVIVEHRQ